jgi:hypothetical protein
LLISINAEDAAAAKLIPAHRTHVMPPRSLRIGGSFPDMPADMVEPRSSDSSSEFELNAVAVHLNCVRERVAKHF